MDGMTAEQLWKSWDEGVAQLREVENADTLLDELREISRRLHSLGWYFESGEWRCIRR